jgi:phytoene synthase
MDDIVEQATVRLARGSKSFAAAAALLPRDKRTSVILLYSWCRHCDDLIDDEEFGFATTARNDRTPAERLDLLRSGTIDALSGRASAPEYAALQRVVHEHGLPTRYPLELLDGMAMDARGTLFHSIDDTLRYCYHVAGVVGVMTAIILGVRDRPTLERASDLGIGLQLTNIARDVVADARRGRVYLPDSWLREAGMSTSSIGDRDRWDELRRVVERLLDLADDYYHSASVGIAELPIRSAWAVAAARRIYGGIGARIRAVGSASWETRTVTGRHQKFVAALLAGADALVLKSLSPARTISRDGLWTPEALTI